jgi:hypothetical protein
VVRAKPVNCVQLSRCDGYEQLELFPLGEITMGKIESRSEKPEMFAKGGKDKMFERGTAHSAVSDVSGKPKQGGEEGNERAKDRKGELSTGKDFTFQKGGGSGRMFGKGHAGKKTAGTSGKESQEG